MLYLFLITINLWLFANTSPVEFQTSCNSSQFADLENLIGSIHRYISGTAYLYVRDNGLTMGQKELLNRYQNVYLILSSNKEKTNLTVIDVTQEFIFINNNISLRHNNGLHSNIDLIRKKLHLAVVIPFIDRQFNNFVSLLRLIDLSTPCRNKSESIDLIFYHNEKVSSEINRRIENLNYTSPCFTRIRIFAAGLQHHENSYPFGSTMMWIKLLIHEQASNISLRYYGYTHFFLMEPDTKPIRSYWLDAIIEQILDGHHIEEYLVTKWWMVGSVYRGSEKIGINFLHINGNALYHLSLSFIEFLRSFSSEYTFRTSRNIGYDFSLFVYLLRQTKYGKQFWHKFQFSDFIQNCWHSGCNEENVEFLFHNPNTYLIHGYNIPKAKSSSTSGFSPFWWLLLLIPILCSILYSRLFRLLRYYFCRYICADMILCIEMCLDVIKTRLVASF